MRAASDRPVAHRAFLAIVLCAALVVGALGVLGPVEAQTSLQEHRDAREEAERDEAEARDRRQRAEREAAEMEDEVAEALARETALRQQRDEARKRLEALEQDFLRAAEAFEVARVELGEIEAELERLEASVKRLIEAIEDRHQQVGHLIKGLYKRGGSVATYEAVLRSEVISETARRIGYVHSAQRHQRDIIEGLARDRRELEAEQAKVDEAREQQVEVAAEFERRRMDLQTRLEDQEREVADLEAVVAEAEAEMAELRDLLAGTAEVVIALRAEEAAASRRVSEHRDAEQAARDRQRREAAARQSGGSVPGDIACPLGQPRWFMDTWGASRSGGRAHQGTDMFAPRHTPIYAYESGSVSMSSNRLGGLVLYLYGNSGNRYYYAHLEGYVSGLSNGQRVSVGEKIGYNGNSGNAITTPPHLHIEVRPGGGARANPYSYMRQACG